MPSSPGTWPSKYFVRHFGLIWGCRESCDKPPFPCAILLPPPKFGRERRCLCIREQGMQLWRFCCSMHSLYAPFCSDAVCTHSWEQVCSAAVSGVSSSLGANLVVCGLNKVSPRQTFETRSSSSTPPTPNFFPDILWWWHPTSVDKYLFSSYYISDTVLEHWFTSVILTKSLPSENLYCNGHTDMNAGELKVQTTRGDCQ